MSTHGLKVLHIHTRYRESGGEDSVVDAERQLLSESEFDVTTLDFQNPRSTSSSSLALAQAPWNQKAVKRAVAKARESAADVVHIHNTWFALSPAVVPALRKAGFPVVMTFHNYRLVCVNAMLYRDGAPCEICVGRSTFSGIRYSCYRDSVTASTMAAVTIHSHRLRRTWASDLSVGVALTRFAKERLLQGGLSPENTVVKPNFVTDPGPRSESPSASDEVLFVGRLSSEKGISQLIDAWQRTDLDGLRLTVIGSGPLASELADRGGSGLQLAGRMPPESVVDKMLQARALVVPSLWFEVQPMVMLEAMAAGLPVFHSDLGALGETAGLGGVSLGTGDPDQMTSALGLLKRDRLIDQNGSAARSEFETRFSARISEIQLGRIYEKALLDG